MSVLPNDYDSDPDRFLATEKHPHDDVHPYVAARFAAALLAPPPALYRMHLDVAALCEIDWYADGPAVLRSFNDTAHLNS